MATTVGQVHAAIESLWPISGAEGWDAPGLLAGDPAATVDHIHLAVDAVLDTVDEAVAEFRRQTGASWQAPKEPT